MSKEDNSSTNEGGSNKNTNKAKSCNGCLYLFLVVEDQNRNPLCVGFNRALQQGNCNEFASFRCYRNRKCLCWKTVDLDAIFSVLKLYGVYRGLNLGLPYDTPVPNYVELGSDIEVSNEGRSLEDFKYACVGYSALETRKIHQRINTDRVVKEFLSRSWSAHDDCFVDNNLIQCI